MRFAWPADERRAFAGFLEREGLSPAEVGAWLGWAERILALTGGARVLPRDVDEAVRQATLEGASPSALAALARTGEALVRHTAERPLRRPDGPRGAGGDLELVPVDRGRESRRASHPPGLSGGRPTSRRPSARPGHCASCGAALGPATPLPASLLLAGAAATGLFALALGTWRAAAISSAVLGAAMLASVPLAAWRCGACGTRARSHALTDAQRQSLRSRRLFRLGGALLALGLSVAAGAGRAFWLGLLAGR